MSARTVGITAVVLLLARRTFRRQRRRRAQFSPEDVRYRAPAGRDPAAALAALRLAGLTVRPEMVEGETELVIRLTRSVTRQQVREILSRIEDKVEVAALSRTVTFRDE